MTTHTTDLGLPSATTPSRWARSRAWLAGYTAHRLPTVNDPGSPYLRARHATICVAEARLTERLHDLIGPLDNHFIAACAQVAHHNADLADLSAAITDITGPRLTDHATTTQRRHERHRTSRQTQATHDLSGTLETISRILTDRSHLVAQAAGILASHVAAAETLISAYHAGQTRRTKTCPETPAPDYQPRAAWAHGDFPLMTMALDAPTRHIAEWAIREFSTTTPGTTYTTATA